MAMIISHPRTREQLAAITKGRSGSYVFHGARSVGKASAARETARSLNCQGDENGPCAHCRQFAAGTYPDFIEIAPEDKPSITIEQVRALIKSTSLALYYANGMRIVLIYDAHLLTDQAQNALLKLIEEPPASTIFLLITDQPEALLETVRSRCAHIYFAPVALADIARFLELQYGAKPAHAHTVAAASQGLPGIAIAALKADARTETGASLQELVDNLESKSPFQRLLLASKLVDVNLLQLAETLQAKVTAQIVAADSVSPDSIRRMAALERFRTYAQAKVVHKVALECLMLEY
jgi:DNA polymerase-3 subunit delta'